MSDPSANTTEFFDELRVKFINFLLIAAAAFNHVNYSPGVSVTVVDRGRLVFKFVLRARSLEQHPAQNVHI